MFPHQDIHEWEQSPTLYTILQQESYVVNETDHDKLYRIWHK